MSTAVVRLTGVVKWFSVIKGYGFIQPEDGGRDVFVHISAVEDAELKELQEGDVVSYELLANRGKTSAVNLELVSKGKPKSRED